MVDIDVKLCKKVKKFRMLYSVAGLWACPKPPNVHSDNFSLFDQGIVLNF